MFSWGREGDKPGEFYKPAGLDLDKYDNVFVSEIGNCRIQKFDKHGKFICAFGSEGSGVGEMSNVHGLTVDEAGNVYVSDSANYRIQKYRPLR